MRNAIFLILGIVIGAAVSIPAFLWFLRTDAGNAVLRSYVVSTPAWPDVQVINLSPGDVQKLPSASSTIPVPKAYANAAYYAAINASMGSLADFTASYKKLVTLLTEINAKSLRGDFNGFFDLITSAKNEIASEKRFNDEFSQHLAELSAANQTSADAATKSLTLLLIPSGTALHAAIAANLDAINIILSGSVPTAAQLNAMAQTTNGAKSALDEYNKVFAPLLERFKDKIEASPPLAR